MELKDTIKLIRIILLLHFKNFNNEFIDKINSNDITITIITSEKKRNGKFKYKFVTELNRYDLTKLLNQLINRFKK